MNNISQVKLGIVAVSRDCFPIGLSQSRRAAVVAACAGKGLEVYEAQTTVENEKDSRSIFLRRFVKSHANFSFKFKTAKIASA